MMTGILGVVSMSALSQQVAGIDKAIDECESDKSWLDEEFGWYWQNEEVSELLMVRDLWLDELIKGYRVV